MSMLRALSILLVAGCGNAPGGDPSTADLGVADAAARDLPAAAADLTAGGRDLIAAPSADLVLPPPPGDAGTTGPAQWVLGYYVGYAINSYPVMG